MAFRNALPLAFSAPAVSLALILATIPAVFTVGPRMESALFPVTRSVEIVEPQQVDGGVAFYVGFNKVRPCEFIGLVWYNGPVRLITRFSVDADLFPVTRPEGEQLGGPWLVEGIGDLEGTTAYVYHRCHPLWTTITQFYPSR